MAKHIILYSNEDSKNLLGASQKILSIFRSRNIFLSLSKTALLKRTEKTSKKKIELRHYLYFSKNKNNIH